MTSTRSMLRKATLWTILGALCLVAPATLPGPMVSALHADEIPELKFKSVHERPPQWLLERFDRAVEQARAGKTGPKASPEAVRAFLMETYEHIREVNELNRALGGKARDIPKEVSAKETLRGIHDFGERVSTTKALAELERLKKEPLRDRRTGEVVPVPKWFENYIRQAAATGQRSIDVGKLNPHVAAGLGRNGPPDPYAIRLHNLSPHHYEFAELKPGRKIPGNQVESIADRVNAMRQIRIYRREPLSWEKVRQFTIEDIQKSKISEASQKRYVELLDRAIKEQRRLERSGKVNPYYKAEPSFLEKNLPRLKDGTIDWKQLGQKARAGTTAVAKQQAKGTIHFAMALFLKELAVVLKTGDQRRIEEFFDGVATTDFFIHYSLFSFSAAGGQMLYARFLEKHVKPRFVSGMLKSTVALAAGLAIPELLRGNFDGKTFMVDLGALGLSSVLVKSSLQGLSFVSRLGPLGKVVNNAKKLQKYRKVAQAGAWFYTAAETAVVLIVAEDFSRRAQEYMDREAVKDALKKSSKALFEGLQDPSLSADELQSRLGDFDQAHRAWRDLSFQGLEEAEQRFQGRLAKSSQKAFELAKKRDVHREQLERHETLKKVILRDYDNLEDYFEKRSAKDDAAIEAEVSEAFELLTKERESVLESARQVKRRESDYLRQPSLDWLAKGAKPGAEGDPTKGRSDWFSRRARNGFINDFYDDLSDRVSRNRLQAYDDQIAALRLARSVAPAAHQSALDKEIELLRGIRAKEQSSLFVTVKSGGAKGALDGR